MKFLQQKKPRAPVVLGTVARWLVALAVGAVVISGCGNADTGSDDGDESNSANNGAISDTGAQPAPDAAMGDAGADTATDASEPRLYEPALADLGAPAEACTIPLVNAEATAGERRARVFVPSYRLDFDVLSSHRAFREHIHRLVHQDVLPCRADDAPNVVVFPESMGLPMLLIGDKAARARQMNDSTRALTSMLAQVDQAGDYYAEKFPAASLTNRFLLAMTDSVVRATYDTFGQLADRYDLFVSVSVNLADFEKTTAPHIVARLGDPEYDAHDYVYEATSAQVHNRQILFGPDGEVVDETIKTHVTAAEIDQLDIAAGAFSDIHPMQTPWGRTGVAISTPAWMPDVQDRLDDVGAQVIFQPEAFIGGWAAPATAEQTPPGQTPSEQTPPEQDQPRWAPDYFLLGGYNLVQRSPRITHNFVSQLTGNFFEVPNDGQVQVVEQAGRPGNDAAPSAPNTFIGQPGPLAGNTFVGPWVVEDPVASQPSASLAERRALLREVGRKLLPGSGDPLENQYVEGMWAADLRLSEQSPNKQAPQVQTHPQIAVDGDTAYVISSAGAVGARSLRVEQYEAGALKATFEQQVPGYDLIRPTVAFADERLHVVAELVGRDENRLAYTAFDPSQDAFAQDATVLEASQVGRFAYHPSIAVEGRVLHLSWIKRSGGANRAFYAQTSLAQPFSNLSVNAEIAPRSGDLPANFAHASHPRAHQWDARIAADPQALATTWIDYEHAQWQVYAAVSTDGGLDWSEPVRLDVVPDGVEALNATPTIAALGKQRFLVAWTDARATRPNTRVAARTFKVAPDGHVSLGDAHLIGEQDAWDKWMWRPSIVVDLGLPTLTYEVLVDGRWTVEQISLGAGGSPGAAKPLLPASPDAKHFAQTAWTPWGPLVAFEQVDPHSGAASTVEVVANAPR